MIPRRPLSPVCAGHSSPSPARSWCPSNPPAVQGLGQFGGFQFEVEDQGRRIPAGTSGRNRQIGEGREHRSETFRPIQQLHSQRSAIRRQYRSEQGEEPERSALQITDALQVFLGSVYVNDFTFNNRSYRVYVQAAQQFRSHPDDIDQFYVRSNSGEMVPLDNLVKITQTAIPRSSATTISSVRRKSTARPRRAAVPATAIDEMQTLAAKVLPRGMSYEWSGLSLEEIQSGSKSAALFGLGLLVVYLTLAAQYESFSLPFIVLMAVPMAMLGALLLQASRGLINDVYCQIGMVMLIGLSSKNAILIVEFAEQLREKGMDPLRRRD